jgi:hypothetical protein
VADLAEDEVEVDDQAKHDVEAEDPTKDKRQRIWSILMETMSTPYLGKRMREHGNIVSGGVKVHSWPRTRWTRWF